MRIFLPVFVFAFAFAGGAFASPDPSAVNATGIMAFVNSFSIIVRESLEAILIISAMVAALTSMGAAKSVKFVHFGWLGALGAGLVTWWATAAVISVTSAQAEIVEGVTSLLAAAVLFYVSYWLISKIEAGKWKKYISSKVSEAAGAKSTLAVMSVAFLAVYREALETVLFFRALFFETTSAGLIFWGLAAGAVVSAALAVAVFKFSLRLPVRYLFSVTGMALYMLSFTLVGKGIHELQESGFISETVAGFVPKVSFLGIYPTYETFVPQTVIAAALVIAAVKVFHVFSDKNAKETA